MPEYGRYGGDIREGRERFYGDDGRERGRGGFFGAGRERERGRFDRDEADRGQRGYFGRTSRSSAWDRNSRHGEDWDRDRDYYGYDDYHAGLPIDETSRLIASNKVEGTPVYGRGGERLGTIYNFMADKYSGQIEYAVMRYGGFLGLGQRYYPLPWRILSYDTHEGGYRIEMSHRDLERAPSFDRDEEPRFSRDYGERVNNWYGLKTRS